MLKRVFFSRNIFNPHNFVCVVYFLFVAAVLVASPGGALALKASESFSNGDVKIAALPKEAQETITLIRRGGPFPYSKDGVVFGNREKALPKQARGFYTEYTVTTPGERTRGARRIVVGGEPRVSNELYYTDDHYQTFKRIRE
jgi:ribonuclease T1